VPHKPTNVNDNDFSTTINHNFDARYYITLEKHYKRVVQDSFPRLLFNWSLFSGNLSLKFPVQNYELVGSVRLLNQLLTCWPKWKFFHVWGKLKQTSTRIFFDYIISHCHHCLSVHPLLLLSSLWPWHFSYL